MSVTPFVAFACAHLCDERLFAPQVAALANLCECRVFVFRKQESLGDMAELLLAGSPERFTLVGLSLGGYVAFEILRRQPQRIERLALLDTTATADTGLRRAGRVADIAKVLDGGIDALLPELPGRWLAPAHTGRADLVALMGEMAHSVGAEAQRNQQQAMLDRPDSHADLAAVKVPTLVLCGEQDAVTPIADHEAIASRIHGAELHVVPGSGHLSTIEQPAAVSGALRQWLAATA